MNARLTTAIEDLYAVFAPYPGNPGMQGSPFYKDLAKWNQRLFSKPLRELTSDDLCLFAGKAMTTWGEINDFKHFLPRLLELTALLEPAYETFILYGKLEYARWEGWEEAEQAAITSFNLALWETMLNDCSSKAVIEFENYFESLLTHHPQPAELITIWQTNDSFCSLRHLSAYIYSNFNRFFLRKTAPFNETITNHFVSWLLSDALIKKLTDAFFMHSGTELEEEISSVLSLIEIEKRVRQA